MLINCWWRNQCTASTSDWSWWCRYSSNRHGRQMWTCLKFVNWRYNCRERKWEKRRGRRSIKCLQDTSVIKGFFSRAFLYENLRWMKCVLIVSKRCEIIVFLGTRCLPKKSNLHQYKIRRLTCGSNECREDSTTTSCTSIRFHLDDIFSCSRECVTRNGCILTVANIGRIVCKNTA